MGPAEGTPWTPRRLDDLMERPFEQLEERQESYIVTRLNQMTVELDELERELDEIIERAAVLR